MLIPVSEPIYARIPQYADRITPPMTQAAANPFRSSPFPSFAPTLILAEKKVNPSITKNMLRNPFLALSGTASME